MAQNIASMRNAQLAQKITWAPYKPLNREAEHYFFELLTCRASFDWSRGDIIMLTRLSEWLEKADDYQTRLELEGITLTNAKGTEVVNPLVNICDSMERRIVFTMTRLAIFAISSSSQSGRGIEGKAAKEANAAAVAAAQDAEDDGLVG